MTTKEFKQYLKEHSQIIFLSLSFAFLLAGILFIIIGSQLSQINSPEYNSRLIISAVCIAIWFLSFPILDIDRKTNLIVSLAIHCICMVVSFIIFYYEAIYFFLKKDYNVFFDIVACFGMIILIAYLLYVFISFFKVIFSYIQKAYLYFFTGNESRSTLLKKTIEAVTAYILSISAFGGSIVGIIAIVKQLIGK